MKVDDNVFPKVIVSEVTAPATPAAATVVVYAKVDGLLYSKDDAGVETLVSGGSGGGGSSLTVQDEGSSLATAAATMNFTGAGVTASGTGATKTVNIPGGGGGVSVPRVVQIKTAGTAATSITLDSAPASGHSVILATNATNTGLVTSVSSTNTTWTRVASRSSASVFYEIWIGVVAGGAGGTAITITHSNSFLSCTAVEVADTLTATAGLTANGTTSASIAATTSGHLIVAMTSNANTTIVAAVDMTILRLGLASAIVPLVVGYSVGDAISVVGTATSGTVVAEVT
jgi:hypothetical protein